MSIVCLYKKGLKSLPENYRALSIGSNLSKILPRIILNRLNNSYECNISEEQFGFRKGRSTCDAIFIIKNIVEKYPGEFYAVFIDLTAAYDHIPREFLFSVLAFRTSAPLLISILRKLYEGTIAKITGSKTVFEIFSGCRQGGIESPTLFNYYFDFVLKVCAFEIDQAFPNGWGLSFDYNIPNECTDREQRKTKKAMGKEMIRWLLYADDLSLFCKSFDEAQTIINIMTRVCKRFGLTISFKKTKVMRFGATKDSTSEIIVDNCKLENVNTFCYLGHTIFNKKEGNYVDLRISKATSKFNELGRVLKDKQISLSTRRNILEACVRSRLTYGLQSWYPSETQLKFLESCWHGFLRCMVKGGFRRKIEDGLETFAFFYTNIELENIVKTPSLREFINIQYLRYIAHTCRRPNTNLVKLSLFFIPKTKYYRDPWLKVCNLLGDISKNQAKRETQNRSGFNELLVHNFPMLKQ